MEAGSLFGSDDFAGAIFDDKRRSIATCSGGAGEAARVGAFS